MATERNSEYTPDAAGDVAESEGYTTHSDS